MRIEGSRDVVNLQVWEDFKLEFFASDWMFLLLQV